jgi:choline dehydrogenase-like flavoprotein
MHIDLDDGVPAELETDSCVIGAGAAGITVARRLLAAGQRVVLVESGGLDFEPDTAALNVGANVGEPYYPLDHARLRFFGGTTAIWGGRCAELDPIDFVRRPWVPHSGWPISHADVAPYYASARKLLDLPEPASPVDLAAAGAPLPAFDEALLRMPLWNFDDRFSRFTFAACTDLLQHPRCTILTHATVTEIVAHPSARGIRHLALRGRAGRNHQVRARHYVLAAGGIENARLLLASRSVMPMGLGNAHDQVGRYFMEHPHARGGRIVGPAAWTLLNAFGRKHRIGGSNVAALIAPAERLQRERGLLNTSLTIAGRRPANGQEALGMRAYQRLKHDLAPSRSARTMWMRTKRATHAVMRVSEPLRPWLLHKLGRLDVALVVRGEQAPNPASRVLLDSETDALGVPRVKLDWRMSALDTDSVAGLVEALGRETERLGLGRVEPESWLSDPSRAWRTDPLISAHAIGGYHHIGTTRMADDPRHGVTDGDGRVHGLDNLHIVGSSLFPTSGWANPTLTILARAQRTADIIARGAAETADDAPQPLRAAHG